MKLNPILELFQLHELKGNINLKYETLNSYSFGLMLTHRKHAALEWINNITKEFITDQTFNICHPCNKKIINQGWNQLAAQNSICLKSQDMDIIDQVYKNFEECSDFIKAEKRKLLEGIETDILLSIDEYLSNENILQGKNFIWDFQTPSYFSKDDWLHQDRLLLKDRVSVCQHISDATKKLLGSIFDSQKDDNPGRLRKNKNEMFIFAPVKGEERSLEKIVEYHKKDDRFVSMHMKLKDMLRCTFIFDEAIDTIHFINYLINKASELSNVSIYQIKNMFKNKKLEDTDYKDIKLILLIDIMGYSEFVEIQFIQDLFIRFKSVEHKVYDFYRLNWKTIKNEVEERQLLMSQLDKWKKGEGKQFNDFNKQGLQCYPSIKFLMLQEHPEMFINEMTSHEIFFFIKTFKNFKFYKDLTTISQIKEVIKCSIVIKNNEQTLKYSFKTRKEIPEFVIRFMGVRGNQDFNTDKFIILINNEQEELRKTFEKAGFIVLDGNSMDFSHTHQHEIKSTFISKNNGHLYTSSWDGKVVIWDIHNGLPKQEVNVSVKSVNCMIESQDGKHLILGCRDKFIRTLNIDTCKLLKEKKVQNTSITSIVSKDEFYFTTGWENNIYKLDHKFNLITKIKASTDVIYKLIIIDEGMFACGDKGILSHYTDGNMTNFEISAENNLVDMLITIKEEIQLASSMGYGMKQNVDKDQIWSVKISTKSLKTIEYCQNRNIVFFSSLDMSIQIVDGDSGVVEMFYTFSQPVTKILLSDISNRIIQLGFADGLIKKFVQIKTTEPEEEEEEEDDELFIDYFDFLKTQDEIEKKPEIDLGDENNVKKKTGMLSSKSLIKQLSTKIDDNSSKKSTLGKLSKFSQVSIKNDSSEKRSGMKNMVSSMVIKSMLNSSLKSLKQIE